MLWGHIYISKYHINGQTYLLYSGTSLEEIWVIGDTIFEPVCPSLFPPPLLEALSALEFLLILSVKSFSQGLTDEEKSKQDMHIILSLTYSLALPGGVHISPKERCHFGYQKNMLFLRVMKEFGICAQRDRLIESNSPRNRLMNI